jgi:hypothetical protein
VPDGDAPFRVDNIDVTLVINADVSDAKFCARVESALLVAALIELNA